MSIASALVTNYETFDTNRETSIQRPHAVRSLDDLQLFVETGKGNRAAFSELFSRHSRRVMGLLLRLTGGNMQKAEDISQRAWLEIIRISPKVTIEKNVRGFIYAVARNQARNQLRKDKEWRFTEYVEERFESEELETPQSLIEAENAERLRSAIDRLPARQRYALTAWLLGEQNRNEIAQEMDISLKAFESLLHRAREAVKKAIRGTTDE